MNIVLHYIKYRLKAKGRHGVHSPFVYSFVNECLTTKVAKNFLFLRKKLFNNLKKNDLFIDVDDFGVGSKSLGKKRKISSIFATSSSRGKYSLLLYKLSNYYKPKNILELGTSLGIGSIHLSFGNQNSVITTIEACKNTLGYAETNFKFINEKNIYPILSTFDIYLDNYSGEKFDIVFIDGHHDGIALLNYLEKLKPHTHNDTLFILDDIRWSNSMFDAWITITKDPFYNVTIDLFRMGIISQRKQQEKEEFVILI